MKVIKANFDYESVLFYNKPLQSLNESLEFLAFYLDERPLLTNKIYTDDFFDLVESLTGHRPTTVKKGTYSNWWGELKNLTLEKKLNSKKMSAELNIQEKWVEGLQIVSHVADLQKMSKDETYLMKNLYGMSGKNIVKLLGSELQSLPKDLHEEVLIEPFLNRRGDFSHYVYPDGRTICYENIVDKHFQYKGTVFNDIKVPTIENLSFYNSVSPEKWEIFRNRLDKIILAYRHPEFTSGFSVDSFIFERDGESHIYALCEVNYRKTMGYIAYELGKKLGREHSKISLELRKSSQNPDLSADEVLLSPQGSRFDVVLKMS